VFHEVSLALRRCGRRPVSWDELAHRSGVSAKRLPEAVAALARRGFVVESHPHLGLTLAAVPPHLDAEELVWNLAVRRVGRLVRCVELATSTNDLAWQAVEQGPDASDGLAVFADQQSAGRGRRGNRWLAPPGTSVLVSVALWLPRGSVDPSLLTRLVAVAAAEAVEAEAPDLDVGIKWPNDLVVDDRKVGGILVEARPGTADLVPVVLGIGFNVSQDRAAFPSRIRPAVTSLAMLGAAVDRTLLARSFLERLDAVVAPPEGAASVPAEAARRCRTLGRRLTVIADGASFTGEVVDLDADYGLVLRLSGGSLRRFPAMTTHVQADGVDEPPGA